MYFRVFVSLFCAAAAAGGRCLAYVAIHSALSPPINLIRLLCVRLASIIQNVIKLIDLSIAHCYHPPNHSAHHIPDLSFVPSRFGPPRFHVRLLFLCFCLFGSHVICSFNYLHFMCQRNAKIRKTTSNAFHVIRNSIRTEYLSI